MIFTADEFARFAFDFVELDAEFHNKAWTFTSKVFSTRGIGTTCGSRESNFVLNFAFSSSTRAYDGFRIKIVSNTKKWNI